MRKMWTTVTFLVLAGSSGTDIWAQIRQDSAICRLQYRLVNRNRNIEGHNLNAECSLVPLFAHSSPFGNWGVDSNEGERKNSRQFDGWKLIDGFYQWNSCTSDTTAFPTGCTAPPGGWPNNPPPHSDEGPYYNHASCLRQFSNQGLPNWDIHAGVAPNELFVDYMVSCATGCLDANACSLGVTGHFMKTYELDSPGSDVQTGHLTFGNQSASPNCYSKYSCNGSISQWVYDDDFSTGVDAEAAYEIVGGFFINMFGYCDP